MWEAESGVWTPESVRTLDHTATRAFKITGYQLMTRAAEAVCAAVSASWPDARRWVVLCGGGNNGGDGYVIARLARRAGLQVRVCALVDPAGLSGVALTAWQDFTVAGGAVTRFTPEVLTEAELVIDAILGTGLARPVTGVILGAIEAVNGAGLPVVAVDIPSGLDSTTGLPLGAAVRADLTITFVGRKLGLYLGEGRAYTGRVEFADLGLPRTVVASAGLTGQARMRLFTASDLPRLLPRRSATAHKGDFGHVLVVGGNHGMSGAVRLAGEAALRAGAGLVSVATRSSQAALLPLVRPELMCHGIDDPADIAPLLARATVVALGPGLGQDAWARALLAAVLATPLPLVVDADALNLLAARPSQRHNWILTPHPGEAGRLLGSSSAEVQHDRLRALHTLHQRYGGTIVLKGSGTLIGGASQPPWLNTTGNAGMATAGMGDVLTGVIAGLFAQAAAPLHGPRFDAELAAAATFVHGAAGDVAARAGQRGVLASDVLTNLQSCLNP